MTDKLELKSSHEVIDTVNMTEVDSIFQGKPTDPDILTVMMKDGTRLYCDEVCPLQEEPVSEDLEEAAQRYNEDMSWCWEAPKYPHLEAFKAGAKWQKEQMMAKAVDGTARPDYNEIWCNLASSNLKDGDKVKVIVIKED